MGKKRVDSMGYTNKTEKVVWKDGQFITRGGRNWSFDPALEGRILLRSGREILFHQAGSIRREPLETGLGTGESVWYTDFQNYPGLTFETRILVSSATGFADCTFVPVDMAGLDIREVCWPGALRADEKGSYAVLNTMQGQLLPADWPEQAGDRLPFGGQMCSETAYMPWWGEITPEGGYLCYVRQSWDSAYRISHPAGGPTRIFPRLLPSLGEMRYARTVTYCFVPAGSDYVTLCQLYRRIAEEEGKVRTLREKAVFNPGVGKLIGCCVMHVDGKTHVTEESAYYDREHPEKNDSLTPFSHWTRRVRQLKSMGVDQLYLHLDGWGQPGYDNQHPDYLPPCREAGGWEGMKELSDTMEELGFLFGIHDQYRDYYRKAATYDPDNAVKSADGTIFELSRWAGGRQNYLCALLAPDYLRRNFSQLFSHGIHLEGAYLDVFTCNEPDECVNPRHPMTRKDCIDARNQCFHYLSANQIVPSSEEVNDWAAAAQVFCHWAPYMEDCAVPVPLFNLVYHDCVMIPWMMSAGEWGIPEGTTGFLQALLNGGMGYLDGRLEGPKLEENIRQWQVIRELQRHVAMERMENHEFLEGDRARQRTTFSDGTQVTVDFSSGTYEISYPGEKEQ